MRRAKVDSASPPSFIIIDLLREDREGEFRPYIEFFNDFYKALPNDDGVLLPPAHFDPVARAPPSSVHVR
jgi:hypothetical protein